MKDKKWMRKALSFLLAVFMVTGSMGTVLTAAAEEPETPPAETVEVVPTEAPEATDVPKVTEIPEVTDVPEATEAPEATDVPEEPESPAATDVPEATETPEATDVPETTEIPETTDVPEVTEAPEIVDEAAVDYSRSVLDNEFFDSGFAATFSSAQLYLNPTGDELVGQVTGVVYVTHRPQKGQLNERISVCVYDQTAGVAYGYLAADAVHPVPEEGIENQRHTGVFASGVEMPCALLVLAAATEEPVPTPAPTPVLTEEPVVVPTEEPAVEPTEEPAVVPTEEPVVVHVIIPGKPTFEMDKATAELGENITFTIHTKNATKILMYIDGSVNRYIYDVPTDTSTLTMSFSSMGSNGGRRTIAFQAYNGNTPGEKSAEQTITLTKPSVKPQVTVKNIDKTTVGLGENITFTLSVKNATKVLMYIDGSVNRRFEDITPDMTEYTFTMSFSSLGNNGGKRAIAFQAYNGTTAGEKTSERVVTVANESPNKPTVTSWSLNKSTVDLNETITFTINTKNATKMRVYIDGKLNRYIYDVKDGATTFQMSFSTLGSNGGVRTVAFQPYNGNTPGAMSDTKTITISVANKPRVELLKISNPNATLGENITFTLRIKNATKVLMYIDGSVNRRFENITPDMTEYTFTMAFSSLGNNGGKRTIAFQAYNGAVGGDKTTATTISLTSGSSAAPVIANVKIDKTTAVLGEQIKFTVYLDNATKLLMYVDGQVNRRFEDVTTSMSKYEFTMSFSSLGNNGGVRTIQFQPYNGTTAGEKFKAYTITLTTTVVNKPEVVNFTMNPSRVKLNVPVTFTVNTKNATKVVLYVDGKANTSYPTTGDVTVIERAFASLGSGNGVRTIQFKPYYGTTAGELSPAQSLTLYVTDDPLTVTVPAAKQGEDLTVTWTAAGGATKYQLLLTTPDGTAALLGETAALNYTVPGLKLLQPGDYTITIKALSGNTELESVNKAFTVTGDFVFAVRDDSTGIVVVKYNGTASTLTVPNTVAGLPVLEIGAQAFEGNTKLKSVTLPATIEIIGRRAFAECKNLLEVK